MARGAGVRNSRLFGFGWRNEAECVGRNVVVFYSLLDQRHVARGALTRGAVFGVMGMLAHRSLESRSILPGVATKAECVASLSQV